MIRTYRSDNIAGKPFNPLAPPTSNILPAAALILFSVPARDILADIAPSKADSDACLMTSNPSGISSSGKAGTLVEGT